MNNRAFMVLGAVSALSLAACVLTTGSGSSDNSGGSGTVAAGGGGAGVGGGGGAGGAGECDEKIGCADAITDPAVDPNDLCEASGDLYDAYAACVCTGACETDCGASSMCTTATTEADSDCIKCIQTSCKATSDACNNDAG